MASLEMPARLVAAAAREGRQAWLATLAATAEDLRQRWSLTLGPPFQPGGQTAWVAPATDRSGTDLVLKLAWRHTEAAHEPDALRLWAGAGAVMLHAVAESDDTIALLLERCRPGTTLSQRPEAEQDVVVAGLLRRLWRDPPPGNRLRPLAEMCETWAAGYEAKLAAGRQAGLDSSTAAAGIELFRTLPSSAERAVVLCTDLHAENVLAACREPWLVIDPKPYIGDPAYDVLQHLLNCPGRLRSDPEGLVRRMADLTGLEPERIRLWLFARCVQEAPDWPGLAEIARRLAPS